MTTTPVRPAGAEHAFGTDPGDPRPGPDGRRPGGAARPGRGSRRSWPTALADADLDGASVCLVVPDGTRTCPLPLLLGAVRDALAGRAREVTVVDRARHPPGHERGAAGPPPRVRGRGQCRRTYPGWRILNHESWRPETFTDLGTIGAERLTELTGGLMSDISVDVRINRHVAEADVAVVVGPGLPARGGRLLRRQQVLLPRGVRTGADRPVALGRGVDHQRRDDRHPRRHPGPRAGQRGRDDDPGPPARALPGRRLGHRHPARGRLRHPGGRLGRLRGDLGGDPRHATSTPPSAGCCRSCRPSTRTSGPRPRASTSWSRSWPTAAR